MGSPRTAGQSQIALFWADGAGTETPAGHWNSIARDLTDDLETPLAEKARLFALLNAAMADAAICGWEAKFTYNFWRAQHLQRPLGQRGRPAHRHRHRRVDVLARHAAGGPQGKRIKLRT
jgi:hypothetical protein